MYYFCLLAGLATGKKANVGTAETTELVDHFPGDYRSRGRVIVALFLSRELRALGIGLTERTKLHDEIAKLVDPLASSHLSTEGMNELNKYSFGGYDVLTEWFDDRPRHLETFLPEFKTRLAQALGQSTSLADRHQNLGG